MNWKLWLEGLAAAAINGAATAAATTVATGQVNKGTLLSAGIGALFGALTYLKTPATQAPAALPPAQK